MVMDRGMEIIINPYPWYGENPWYFCSFEKCAFRFKKVALSRMATPHDVDNNGCRCPCVMSLMS
jgi:hypothetical protein